MAPPPPLLTPPALCAFAAQVGGAVQNSARALTQLLATLHDPATGRVLVKGFYDRCAPRPPLQLQTFLIWHSRPALSASPPPRS